ncbi:cytoskeleton-associated protein 4 [Discoglossus pictus]
MSNSRQRNKSHPAENSSPPASDNVAKKHNKSKGGAQGASAGAGVLWKVFNVLFYVGLIAAAALSGWLIHNLVDEVSQVSRQIEHLSHQKGELAETVDTLHKQVDLLQKTVGRLEFISKDIQEQQLTNDGAIKKGEKEMEQIGAVLKKMQKDLSSVIQDVKGQGDRDLLLFEKTTKEKLTEFTNSINEDISEFTETQKANENEINNIKTQLASIGEFSSLKDQLNLIREHTTGLQNSFQSNQESIEWLINTVEKQTEESATVGKEIDKLRIEHDDLKKDLNGKLTAIEGLKEKLVRNEVGSDKDELEKLLKDYEQLTSAINDLETNFASTNDDLVKEIQSNKDNFELRLTPLESIVEKLNSEESQQLEKIESLKSSLEDYIRRLNAVEEGIVGLKSSSGFGDAGNSETLLNLVEAQQTLSKDIDELRSAVAQFPSTSSELQKLQLEVTSALETQKSQLEELKYDHDQLKSNTGRSDSESSDEALRSSVNQFETDLKMLRTAVDSLVAYSVKIETNEKDLVSMKESVEELQQITDKLQVKLEQIQENV